MVPSDPVMLLSYLNLKLRDYGKDLDGICEELELDRSEVEKKLAGIDYHYDAKQNQFI